MEYVVMVRKSFGNAETGTAWTECAVFQETVTLKDIQEWLADTDKGANPYPALNRGDVTLQIAQRPIHTGRKADF